MSSLNASSPADADDGAPPMNADQGVEEEEEEEDALSHYEPLALRPDS